MRTYTQIIYQIVFSTYSRAPVLKPEKRQLLFKYIWGILENKKCHLYQINGVEDHIHIATHLHPQVSLSSLVKDIKIGSSIFIKEKQLFPDFTKWQDGYGAFTYSIREKESLIEYIKQQESHHKKITFKEELISLLTEHGVEYDERYLD
ncbi:MAG: IS200/IS605 family transposase [Lewinellaceae bacterium]|nr:IS200/IS605 family transposase [Lewinellaceae bacterium]